MKNITKGASKLTRLIIPLIVLLLTTGATPTLAGILDTINSKVTTIQNRTSTILSNTNGVQDLVTNVRGMSSGFRDGVFSDLQQSLGEVQDLIAYLKERRDNAGNPADYPDLAVLITSLESIMGILQDNPSGGDFGVLSQLLQILPDKLLAVAARAVSKAGVDAEFVNRINQTAIDLTLLTDTITRDTQEEADRFEDCPLNITETPMPGIDELPCKTSCDRFNSERTRLRLAAIGVAATGSLLNVSGQIMDGLADTVQTDTEIGIHGYAGKAIKTDVSGAVGKVTAGIGEAMIEVSNFIVNKLRHCEILYHQAEIIKSNQEVLDNNAILLEEVCRLTRYRSANCQALLP